MKKYVIVGCGHRSITAYAVPMVKSYSDCVELVGVLDTNHKRAALVSEYVDKSIRVFDDFDAMLETTMPDTVIVVTKDSAHDEYIIKALEAGCDVISEKPLTTTFEKANAILEAKNRTGKDVTVTFNLRYHPVFKYLKEKVYAGIIGKVLSVHYDWFLDRSHGADYFRRWHRIRENSGSLLVHKSTHHFDIANWILEEDPVSVNAFGTRRFYGDKSKQHSERCKTCEYKDKCGFYFDLGANEDYKKLYLDCEQEDGYFRDKCVFSDEIDIEDSVSVNVQYSGGAVMSYSLTAHSPIEGHNIILNGTDGRLEYHSLDNQIILYNAKGERLELPVPDEKEGTHGGADPEMQNMLFRGHEPEPIGQEADLRAGLMSIGIGMAANISMKEGRQVKLSEFYPDYLLEKKQ